MSANGGAEVVVGSIGSKHASPARRGVTRRALCLPPETARAAVACGRVHSAGDTTGPLARRFVGAHFGVGGVSACIASMSWRLPRGRGTFVRVLGAKNRLGFHCVIFGRRKDC